MNKKELIQVVSAKTGFTQKDVGIMLDLTLNTISEALCGGDKVQLMEFGAFLVKERSEHLARNPKTKEVVLIPASAVPSFKPSKVWKEKVNRSIQK